MLTYPPTIHPPTYLPTYLARARFGNYEAARRSSEAAALGSYTSFLPTYLVMQFCPDKVLLPTLTRGTPLLLLLFYLNIHFKARLIKSGLLCRKNFKGMFENETAATCERNTFFFFLFKIKICSHNPFWSLRKPASCHQIKSSKFLYSANILFRNYDV